MVDLNAHEAGNGGQKPREAYSPLSLLYSEWDLLKGRYSPRQSMTLSRSLVREAP
jgi:hypothetical protein